MRSRKGIELSINFVVVIVLSVVMLGFGLTLLYKSVGSAWQRVEDIAGCSDSQVMEQLGSGRITLCPALFSKAYRSKSYSMYVGIYNAGDSAKYFKAVLIADSGVDSRGQPFPPSYTVGPSPPRIEFTYPGKDTEFLMQAKEKKVIPVTAEIPKETAAGTYHVSLLVGSCDAPAPQPPSIARNECNCDASAINPCYAPVESITIDVK